MIVRNVEIRLQHITETGMLVCVINVLMKSVILKSRKKNKKIREVVNMGSSTPGFESGKKSEPQTTYHRLKTNTAGSSNHSEK